MKLGIGLVILSIAILDSSQHTNYTVVEKSIDDVTDSSKYTNYNEMTKKTIYKPDISAPGEKRLMSIFPKISQKFVVTMKSIEARNNSNPFNKPSNRTSMFKLIPRVVKIKNENYWRKTTTRQPLMKFTKFTINPQTTLKIPTNFRAVEKETARKYKNYVFNRMMGASKREDSSEEEGVAKEERDINEKAKYANSFTSSFRKIRSRIINNTKSFEQLSKPNRPVTDNKHTSSEFSSEEKEDKEEFIFVKPKEIDENGVKAVKESSESEEMTTVVFEHETKKRHKRGTNNNNIIEEENLGTTISGFKFTGKVASLSSDLVFRNINT